jgi:hypothetical protein
MRDVLGLLAVSRRDLSLFELAELTGASQRSLHESAVAIIRPFLAVVSGVLAVSRTVPSIRGR